MDRNSFNRLFILSCLLGSCLFGLAGCSSLPNCSAVPYPKAVNFETFKNNNAGAEEILHYGDYYRDLCHQAMFKTVNWPLAYCYGEEAEKFYRHLLEELEPHNAYAMVNLGYLSLMRSHGVTGTERDLMLGSAYGKFNQALELRPGYADAHRYRGEYYVLRQDYKSAEQEYRKLLNAGVKESYLYAWMGYVIKQQGKSSEAKQLFRQAVERGDSETASAWARNQL